LKLFAPKTCVLNGKAHRFGEYRLSGERFARFGARASTQGFRLNALEMLGFLGRQNRSGEWFESGAGRGQGTEIQHSPQPTARSRGFDLELASVEASRSPPSSLKWRADYKSARACP